MVNGVNWKNSRSILTDVTTWLNTFLKEIFINILSNYYATIGEIVTYPLRLVFQVIVNFLFSCESSCTSIV